VERARRQGQLWAVGKKERTFVTNSELMRWQGGLKFLIEREGGTP
jgi:hypothetical protein